MLDQSISAMARGLREKAYSAVELCQAYLTRIEESENHLNAFISVCPDTALAAAKAADDRIGTGDSSPLLGIPLAHKDLYCTAGLKTSCGSKMLDNFVPPYDATVVSKLNQAGAVTLGKTNMDEFAMGSSNENSYYGPVKNPWDLNRVPGGSSGGSAAAVAAGLVPVATGTDTGGSIRQPASFCGISGIKPTYGRCSRLGMVAFASSLDQAGVLGRSIEDCATVLECMAGHDAGDSTSADQPVPAFSRELEGSLNGLKVGLPSDYFGDDLDPNIRKICLQAAEVLVARGATLHEVSLPNMALTVPAYYIIAPAECSSNLSRFDGVRYGYRCDNPKNLEDLYSRSRAEGFGDEVKRRIMVGAYALSAGYYDAYYSQAQRIRRLVANDFSAAFEKVDLLLGPTCPGTAFGIGEKTDDPVNMYLSDVYTVAANLAGLPALSMPGGFVEGLPVGVQLIGPHFSESLLLQTGHAHQQDTQWHLQRPEAS